jgi:hypothetical protein
MRNEEDWGENPARSHATARPHSASHRLSSETSSVSAFPNGTSDILAVVRPQMLGGAGPEPSHKSLAGHPPPQVKEGEWLVSSLPMRPYLPWFLAACLVSGCGIIMLGEPVKHQDLSTEDDAEENLKAIRAMQADRASRRPEEENLSPQPSPPDAEPSPVAPSSGFRLSPSPSSSAGRADVPAKLPWTPTAPDRPTSPDRPVPSYTVPAPVGPDYSGSVRCTPDGMGGQRCAGR